jgi:hypothetical protein
MENDDSQCACVIQVLSKVTRFTGGSDKPRYVGQTQFSRSLNGSDEQMGTEVRKNG